MFSDNPFKINLSVSWQICLVFILAASFILVPDFASAASNSAANDPIGSILCKVVNMLTGTAGKAIAMIAVVVLGIGLFLGKLSWALALATAIGIGLIFSAGNIVGWIQGSTAGGAAGNTCP
jgi:type IV secretory pathway VirB2 component (pilin)